MVFDPIRWNPGQMPEPVRQHLEASGNGPCPDTLEWYIGEPETVAVSPAGSHFQICKWFKPGTNHNGFAILLGDADKWLVYGAWMPERLALKCRDDLNEMWPLDKFPKLVL